MVSFRSIDPALLFFTIKICISSMFLLLLNIKEMLLWKFLNVIYSNLETFCHNSLVLSVLYGLALTSVPLEKPQFWLYGPLPAKWCLCFLTHFLVFLPRSKCVLILWLQSLSAVILEPKKIKSITASTFPPSICHKVIGPNALILVFWILSFKPAFSTLFFHPYQDTLLFLFAFCC